MFEARMTGPKPAVQERSRRTQARMLEAMDALLREKQFVQLTVAELAARAGVAPASIYQRFSNRDALVAILIELFTVRAQAWASSSEGRLSFEGVTGLHDALRRLGRRSWDMATALGHVMAPAYVQSRLRPDLLGAQWAALEAQERGSFRTLLAMFAGDLQGADAEVAGEALTCFANMMMLARLLHWPMVGASRLPADRESYGVMLADLACGYLQQAAERRLTLV